MKLGVCGDSYMSSISYNPNDIDNGSGKHFTELLGEKLGWEVVTFARGACSNQAIRLQIDEIIKQRPDCVIIGTTSPDRIEFPIKDLSVNDYFDKFSLNDKIYNPMNGLYNIDYRDFPDLSSQHENFKKIVPTLTSETIGNMFNNPSSSRLNKNEIKLVKDWFQRFFDTRWKAQQDTWIISNGLRKLMDENIDFYCINNFLDINELSIYGDRIIEPVSKLNPWTYYNPNNNKIKYRFHTSLEDQETLANKWYEFLINRDNGNRNFI